MKLGVVFPQTEIGADPGGVRAFAQAAEELGYDHLLAYDHVLGADIDEPPGLARPVHAPSTSSTRSSSSSATSPPSRRGSSSSPACSSCRSGRPRSSRSRRPRSTCSPAGVPARRRARLELRRVRGARRGLHEPRAALGGADRGDAPALDGAGRRLRGPLAPHPGGRDQPAPGAAPDPDLDRRLGRGGDPAGRAACGRLLPAAAARGRLARDDGALPRLDRGGRPRSRRDGDRVADQRRRGHAGRLAARGGGVARSSARPTSRRGDARRPRRRRPHRPHRRGVRALA